jgi:CAI-1 autoinducer synthase
MTCSSIATTLSNAAGHLRHPVYPEFLARRIARFRERVRYEWRGGHILRGRIPGPDAIRLSSNDYLAIARHPAIVGAAVTALRTQGNGVLMSGIFLHGDDPQLQLERRLARFMGAEHGVVCQSGWCANTGLIQSIANEHTPVYVDILAHMSLWEGIRSAGAPAVPFRHNDMEHLARQIARHGPGIIAVDSVYSTNGSLCPLEDVVELGNASGCILVVDESHSLGTHGRHGEGLVASLGLSTRVHFRTASLAKAFAARAGFIACADEFVDYFKFESNPAIFSSTLLPHEVAGLAATLEVIQSEDWRRSRLHAHADYLRHHLEDMGYNLNDSQSQIVSLEPGGEAQAIVLRNALETRGIFGSVFCAPATAKNRALMRLSINSALTDTQLRRIVAVCHDIRNEVGMAEWPSTLRRRRSHRRTPDLATA